ncbi:MAG: hypothetical protein IJI26_00955 [Clostridia bacterium]|nr:hypothetical protein [Clostridia bacterium]
MKKLIVLILIAATALALCGCGAHKAECKVVSAEFVENVPMNGIWVDYEGKDIYKIVFSATLAEPFDGDGAKGDDFRKAMYSRIKDGCKLTFDGGAGEQVWGYWPEKASKHAATKMTLFYIVPDGTEMSALIFTLDGSVLGDAGYQFSYSA